MKGRNERSDGEEKGRHRQVPAARFGHRFAGSADRAPHRADQHDHGSSQDPLQGFQLPAWGVETGVLAKQSAGAAVVRYGDSVVLVTACATETPRPGIDFLPLVADYVEKTFAVGKIPGGFFKREGRLSEFEILTSRMIDRPIRPLFPKGFYNEVQVIATVLSADKENDTAVLAMIGASTALSLSELPFEGPLARARPVPPSERAGRGGAPSGASRSWLARRRSSARSICARSRRWRRATCA